MSGHGGDNRSPSGHWQLVLLLVTAVAVASCGDKTVGVDSNDNDGENATDNLGEGEPDEERWLNWENEDFRISPWTYVLETQTVEAATVEDDRLIFPAGTSEKLDSLGNLDIVVGNHEESPFLRRITDVEEQGNELILETEQAKIEDAVLEGSVTMGGRLGPSGAPNLSSHDDNQNNENDEDANEDASVEESSTSISDYIDEDNASLAAALEASLVFSTDGDISIDVEIEHDGVWENVKDFFTGEDQYTHQVGGTRQCDSNSECPGPETCERWTDSGDPFTCTYESEAALGCSDLVERMDYFRAYDNCQENMKDWWDDDYSSPRPVCGSYEAPYQAQAEWAKTECGGALQLFDAQLTQSVGANLHGPTLSLEGQLNSETAEFERFWDGKTFTFWVGWVPVVVRLQPGVTATAQLTSSGTAQVGPNNPTGITFTVGARLLYQNDQWHEPSFTGTPEPSYPTAINTTAEAEANLDLTVAPRLNAIFYEVGGPFIEPTTINTGLDAKWDSEANPEEICNVGYYLGLSGKLGLYGQIPFGEGGNDVADFQLYQTCSDANSAYCSATGETACYRECFLGCEPDEARAYYVLFQPSDGGEIPEGQNDPAGFEVDTVQVQPPPANGEYFPEYPIGAEIDGGTTVEATTLYDETLDECRPPDQWNEAVAFEEYLVVGFNREIQWGDTIEIQRPGMSGTCSGNSCDLEGSECVPSGSSAVYVADEDFNVGAALDTDLTGVNESITVEAHHLP